VSRLVTPPLLPIDVAPHALALGPQSCVRARGHPCVFPGQFAVAVETTLVKLAVVDGFPYRAAWFAIVYAIAEPAVFGAASALVSSTIGCALLSQASAGIRPRSTSPSTAVQISTVSTFAAGTCPCDQPDF
jgi:hypothetical protein